MRSPRLPSRELTSLRGRGGRGRGKRRGRAGRVAPGGCRTEHPPPHGARRLLGPAREKPRLRAEATLPKEAAFAGFGPRVRLRANCLACLCHRRVRAARAQGGAQAPRDPVCLPWSRSNAEAGEVASRAQRRTKCASSRSSCRSARHAWTAAATAVTACVGDPQGQARRPTTPDPQVRVVPRGLPSLPGGPCDAAERVPSRTGKGDPRGVLGLSRSSDGRVADRPPRAVKSCTAKTHQQTRQTRLRQPKPEIWRQVLGGLG